MTIFRFSLLLMLATGAQADPVITPSGLSVTLYDVVLETEVARFRYLAPAIDPAGCCKPTNFFFQMKHVPCAIDLMSS